MEGKREEKNSGNRVKLGEREREEEWKKREKLVE